MRNGRIEKTKNKFSVISFIRIISILVILVCIGLLVYRYINLKNSDKILGEINSDIKIEDKNIEINGVAAAMVDTDVNSLKEKNPDTVAYLKVNGTDVAYPVVQSNDNEYYLRHSFDKSYSQAGWIFMDYRNDAKSLDKNTIIYGHNMLNNSMFSTLTKMTKSSFFNDENNSYINLSTENKSTLWKIFSVYITDPNTYYMTIGFSSDNSYLEFLNNIKEKGMYNFNENIGANDKILTLSTCTNLNTKRLVIHAKLVYSEDK